MFIYCNVKKQNMFKFWSCLKHQFNHQLNTVVRYHHQALECEENFWLGPVLNSIANKRSAADSGTARVPKSLPPGGVRPRWTRSICPNGGGGGGRQWRFGSSAVTLADRWVLSAKRNDPVRWRVINSGSHGKNEKGRRGLWVVDFTRWAPLPLLNSWEPDWRDKSA